MAALFRTEIIKDNTTITDVKDIANEFNYYFANIGINLAKSIPENHQKFTEYLSNPQTHSFYLFPTTSQEIEIEISELNPKKPTGPFSIPTKLLKIAKYYLSIPLEYLFNCSFSTI